MFAPPRAAGIATNVWRGHAVLRADVYNDRVFFYQMTRTSCKGGPQHGASTNYGKLGDNVAYDNVRASCPRLLGEGLRPPLAPRCGEITG
jgi:hypothetical protein